MRIAFLGAGKMAQALISHLGASTKIVASDKDKRRLRYVRAKYKVKIAKNNFEAFEAGDVVVLAVKPQDMAEVIAEVTSNQLPVIRRKLIISIAAGISIKYLEKAFPKAAVIRAMPNNPTLVGAGITALAAGSRADKKQLSAAKEIFASVGEVVEVEEKMLDAVTGLSGSGPAFIYLAMEALTAGGVAAGLSKSIAAKLAFHTVLGAAKAVIETGKSPEELRDMVTSPGGTTIEGLKVLDKGKFKGLLSAAVVAAKKSLRFFRRNGQNSILETCE